jgi:Mrp family chromosome partitioning ATPase
MSRIDSAFLRAYRGEEDEPRAPVAVATNLGPPPVAVATVAPQPPIKERSAAPRGERKPLSSFAPATPAIQSRFQPALAVDRLAWNGVVNSLFHVHRQLWTGAVDKLIEADAVGRSLIGVIGSAPGVGATTVTTCLARLLAATGKTVAVVDGNFARAGLALHAGVTVEAGWEDALAGRIPLAEAAIRSRHDRLTLVPLSRGGDQAAESLASVHASSTGGILRYHYDVVLFDLGSAAELAAARRIVRHCRLDGVVLATDGAEPPAEIVEAGDFAAVSLGIIENRRAA